MSKMIKNLIVSVLVIIILIGTTKYLNYIDAISRQTFIRSSSFTVFFVNLFSPILIGVIITIPFGKKLKKNKFNWSKFLIQGIPALIIAIPWNRFLFTIGTKFHITTHLGPNFFTSFLNIHTSLRNYSLIAGVWFGKVLIDSIFKSERIEQVS